MAFNSESKCIKVFGLGLLLRWNRTSNTIMIVIDRAALEEGAQRRGCV